jgi:glycine cleavage system H protein
MKPSSSLKRAAKIGLIFLGIAVAFVLALPLLAALALAMRVVLVAAFVVAILAVAASPTVRAWLLTDDAADQYRGVRVPDREWLNDHHAWARVDSDRRVTVGADDLLVRALGPIDRVELVAPGVEVEAGDTIGMLHSGDRRLPLRAPLAGRIEKPNDRIGEQPDLVNRAPYGIGWVSRLQPADAEGARSRLHRGPLGRAWFRTEVDHLIAEAMPADTGWAAAQDGGEMVEGLHEQIDDGAWQRIQRRFFGESA